RQERHLLFDRVEQLAGLFAELFEGGRRHREDDAGARQGAATVERERSKRRASLRSRDARSIEVLGLVEQHQRSFAAVEPRQEIEPEMKARVSILSIGRLRRL